MNLNNIYRVRNVIHKYIIVVNILSIHQEQKKRSYSLLY